MSAQSHYNKQASVERSQEEAHVARQKARTKQLRNYHNDVKRRMIVRFSSDTDRLLDLACGRGGDMWKWHQAGIKHVDGLDIAESEVAEAQERFKAFQDKQPDAKLQVNYRATSDVGTARIQWPYHYDSTTCMFAAHYFFESESMCHTFMDNVSRSLKDGGVFYGTVICGKRVLTCLKDQESYRSDLLAITKKWKGRPEAFGSGYTFAMLHTVTNDHHESDELGDGCVEYVTYFKVFEVIAARHGLYPDPDFDWSFPPSRHYDPEHILEPHAAENKYTAFRYFRPSYTGADAKEQDRISRLYAAFVFKKDEKRFAAEQQKKQDAAAAAAQQGDDGGPAAKAAKRA